MSNSGMHVARSLYMLTTYQYFSQKWLTGMAIYKVILTIARDWVVAMCE